MHRLRLRQKTTGVSGLSTRDGVKNTILYDKAGQVTSITAAKIGTTTVNAAYNAADQLCWTSTGTGTCAAPPLGATTYTYDANGSQTKGGAPTSTWSTFDQLASHTNSNGVTTSHTYAGQANTERLACGAMSFLNGSLGITQQTNASGTTSFIRDPEGTHVQQCRCELLLHHRCTGLNDPAHRQRPGRHLPLRFLGQRHHPDRNTSKPNPWRFAGGYTKTTPPRSFRLWLSEDL